MTAEFARRAIALLLLGGSAWAAPPLPAEAPGRSLGTVTCANSLCHGSITEWTESNVLQTEYVTWSRHDAHARAYTVLLEPEAQAMARRFGLKQPAQEAKECLDCHAHNVPETQRGERFHLADGVSCEACHGPAENWLAAHVAPEASHAGNLARGLYPAEQPRARAQLCLSCHSGNADRFVSHRLMAAGHPRLSFELDTFSAIAPAHHRVDADYRQRKPGADDGVQVWAMGQALAVSEMLAILMHPTRGRDGLFPELVLFDCHACHHPMSDRRWQPAPGLGAGPGVVRLNDSGILMLQAIAGQLDPLLGGEVQSRIAQLQLAVAGQGEVMLSARRLNALALRVADRIEQHRFDDADLRGIGLGLIDAGLRGRYRDYAGAEQAAMAIGSVLEGLRRRGALSDAAAANAALQALNAALADDERYRPDIFAQRLRVLRTLLAEATS
ncbi:MAG TPA: multiheme c-type cytochrome [Arenimonas sp.]|nr:multiheme c-type cytochrome [Arenimonas sp.]